MIHLLLALLAVQSDDEVVKKLSDESVDVRKEMSAALVKKGRAAAAQLRRIAGKDSGQAKAEAQHALAQISANEVKALLEKEGIKGIGDLVILKDDAVAKQLPTATVYLMITEEEFDCSGKRVVVVNNLDDEKGAPKLLKEPADIVPLFTSKASSKDEAAGIARAVFYLLRATQPKAHSDDLVARDGTGHDGKLADWSDAANLPLKQVNGAWRADSIAMQFGHEFRSVTVAFNKDGRLTELKTDSTGVW